MLERAYAKINLFLDVEGVRDDGFHDIKTLMHSVGLCDELEFFFEDSDEIVIEISADKDDLPCDKSNIIYRAAETYLKKYGISAKVNVMLKKNIPVCAGLGGGSADGAATLRAMNRRFSMASDDELLEIATEIGSDVPFCVFGGAALCEGRGEILTPISPISGLHTVIAIGKEKVSTPKAYAEIDKKYPDLTVRREKQNLIFKECSSSLSDGRIKVSVYNIFEEVVVFPEIDVIKKKMNDHGAFATLMSGSGPSVFGFFDSKEHADDAVSALSQGEYQAYYTTTIGKI